MMIDPSTEDDPDDDQGDSDDSLDDLTVTPEQLANMRRALAHLNRAMSTTIDAANFKPDLLVRGIGNAAAIVEMQRDRLVAMLKPMLAAEVGVRERIESTVTAEALRNLVATQATFASRSEQLVRNVDFAGIAAISETFARQQSTLFENLRPAMEGIRATFYPPNLRAVAHLKIKSVTHIVMVDGIPLYGVPRTTIAEALVHAASERERRAILGRRWKAILADCREVLSGCSSGVVARYVPIARAALDALGSGHPAAAQALAGSLTDAIVNDYFGRDRYQYTPNKRNPTSAAYDELAIRDFIAFAPIWRAYQRFFAHNGDRVPTTFSRNATAHTVSPRQFSRRNAVQGLMLVCSLLYRWNEEATQAPRRLEP